MKRSTRQPAGVGPVMTDEAPGPSCRLDPGTPATDVRVRTIRPRGGAAATTAATVQVCLVPQPSVERGGCPLHAQRSSREDAPPLAQQWGNLSRLASSNRHARVPSAAVASFTASRGADSPPTRAASYGTPFLSSAPCPALVGHLEPRWELGGRGSVPVVELATLERAVERSRGSQPSASPHGPRSRRATCISLQATGSYCHHRLKTEHLSPVENGAASEQTMTALPGSRGEADRCTTCRTGLRSTG